MTERRIKEQDILGNKEIKEFEEGDGCLLWFSIILVILLGILAAFGVVG